MKMSIAILALLIPCLFVSFADAHGGVQFAPAGHCQSGPVFIPRAPVYSAPIYAAPAPVFFQRQPVFRQRDVFFAPAPSSVTIIEQQRGLFRNRSKTTVIQR